MDKTELRANPALCRHCHESDCFFCPHVLEAEQDEEYERYYNEICEGYDMDTDTEEV